MPSVHFTSTAIDSDGLDGEALALLGACRTSLAERPLRFTDVEEPAAADFIVFIEPPRHKLKGYARILLEQPAIQRFPERCFAYDWAVGPAGFLPGVYTSIPRSRWDPTRLVPGGYLRPYNEAVTSAAQAEPDSTLAPTLLMSFRGSASHDVRTRLAFAHSVRDDPEIDFSLTDEWFTHTPAQKFDYVARMQGAKFALCPRGAGPQTFRIYEAMALGRAPVILSDEWIGPAGPDWAKFTLVISEARISELPQLVREREGDWAQMGRAAREAWREFFAQPVAVRTMLEAVERISLSRPRGETLDELRARWSSRRFKRDNDWAAAQRLARLMTSPEVRRRLRRRLHTPEFRAH